LAITAGERGGRLARWGGAVLTTAAAAAVAVASCTPGAAPPPAPVPTPGPSVRVPMPSPSAPVPMPGPFTAVEGPTEPQIRLGLVVGAPVATVSGTAGLSVSDPSGARLAEIPAGEVWRVTAGGTGLVVLAPGGAGTTPSELIEIGSPDPDALVQVNGRPYRGTITALRDRTGVTVVDRV
jgi:hypothetical protein